LPDRIPPVLRPEHPAARSLAGLVSEFGLEHTGALEGVELTGITLRSNEVQPGDLFVGVPGAAAHGAEFAESARDAGAVAILTDRRGAEIAEGLGLPIVIVDSPRAALGELSSWLYRTNEHPPLTLGVTGTNGKTSTSYILEGILRQLGLVTGLSTTAERHIGELTVVSRLTTPEASEIHALLARMRESEVRAVVLEVSAQALSRNRVDGIGFDVVSFTNLSHDHLDDYADMEEYFEAKLAFFDPDRARRGVVCLDSPWGERVVAASRIPVTTVSSTPGVDAEWIVEILEERAEYTSFRLTGPEHRAIETSVPLIGRHMASNAALAIVMLVEAGFELEAIGHAVQEGIDTYLPGRTERVSGDRGPAVFVDFGHSPDAFLNTLSAVRTFTTGRVIMLFGADGDRDATKRHEMGRIASEHSDVLVITDHHPRFEDAASIRRTLIEGAGLAEHQAELHEVSPPEDAIRHVIALAEAGDTVLWAGPGHQDYRDIRGVRTPYSARALAREALREAGWA
jgi:UDP-N-acetylmuramoyl-L-alanyl-D-glutamate--2,6-diaminopimelate ligase